MQNAAGVANSATIAGAVVDSAITAPKIAANAVDGARVADESLTGADVADGSIGNADIADGSIGSADIADGSISSADIQDLTRTISFPAQALAVNAGSTIITDFAGSFGGGLRWQSNASAAGVLSMARPTDWNGSTDVIMSLYLYPFTGGAGNIDFFVRPRSYDVGGQHNDVAGISSIAPVPATGDRVIREQQFKIARSSLQGALWVVAIQRKSAAETFTGDVAVLAVKMTYNADR